MVQVYQQVYHLDLLLSALLSNFMGSIELKMCQLRSMQKCHSSTFCYAHSEQSEYVHLSGLMDLVVQCVIVVMSSARAYVDWFDKMILLCSFVTLWVDFYRKTSQINDERKTFYFFYFYLTFLCFSLIDC
jgi:hypothetical protein